MEIIELFFLVWMWLLPMVAIACLILVPTVWFFIFPKISKKLMWARFRNSSILALADDSGWVELVVTDKIIPEGIVETKKHGWFFLPRPRWSKEVKHVSQVLVERMAATKYMLKDLGKPFWFAYSGKVLLVNPKTLASITKSGKGDNPAGQFQSLLDYAKTLPPHLSEPLVKLVEDLKAAVETKPLTILQPQKIKEIVASMHTPSQIEALATNREQYGMLKRGHEYGKLIIGAGLIIGLVIIAIVAIMYLSK